VFEVVLKLVWKWKFVWGMFDEIVLVVVQRLLLSQFVQTLTCTDSGTTISATGSGCWLTKSICLGTDLVAFYGVLVISPPKCLSNENRFEGESHWGRSEVGGSSGSSVHSAVADDCSA